MSLTLPAVYSAASKQGNIQENWIIQLGFYNGDAQGSGEGGWEAALQTNGSANIINAIDNTTDTTTEISDTTVFVVGDHIKINNEILRIVGIDDGNDEIEFTRGAMGTTAATHSDEDPIYWNNFTAIACSDTTVSNVFYRGVVTNKPSIRSSIDLANSTAKTGNISLSLANFQHRGDDFSAELLGTRKYINREVRVFSQLNGESTLSNCLQIYQGRLTDIAHDDSSISLQITEQRPWDFITFPQNKSTNKKILFPVAYGDFTATDSPTTANSYCSGKTLFPIPVAEKRGDSIYSLSLFDQTTGVSSSTTGTASPNPHLYDNNIDRFIPIYTDSSTDADDATETYENGNALKSYFKLKRAFKIKPVELVSAGGWSDGANAIDTPIADDDSSTFAYVSHDINTATTTTSEIEYKVPQIVGKVTSLQVQLRALILGTFTEVSGGAVATMAIYNSTYDLAASFTSPNLTGTVGAPAGTNATVVALNTFTSANLLSSYTAGEGLSTIKFYASTNLNNTTGDPRIISTFKVYDVRLLITGELDFTEDEIQSSTNYLEGLNFLYSGGDGYTGSFTSASGAASTGLEAHRDMLARYAGFDAAKADVYNYNSGLDVEENRIDGSGKVWNVRWWANEPVSLKKTLEQLQKEFCFIFKWRADGSGSYWIVKDSYSDGDQTQTLNKNDIANLKIKMTPFGELITKMEVNYEKHPAQNRYLSSVTSEDTTNKPRKKWNIQSKENIKEINLDMNVDKPGIANPGGSTPNAGFSNYQMNIYGDVKKIVSCDIINPGKSYDLETGDIIQFSNTAGEMPVEPFNDNWADFYMITDLVRKLGAVKITAREV